MEPPLQKQPPLPNWVCLKLFALQPKGQLISSMQPSPGKAEHMASTSKTQSLVVGRCVCLDFLSLIFFQAPSYLSKELLTRFRPQCKQLTEKAANTSRLYCLQDIRAKALIQFRKIAKSVIYTLVNSDTHLQALSYTENM